MAIVNKNFKIKNGLIVEGATATVGGYDVLTKKPTDQTYIIGLIGGAATSENTPDTVVLRDGDGNFAAGAITVDELTLAGAGYVKVTGDDIVIANTNETDVEVSAYDIRINAADDVRVLADDLLRLTSTNGYIDLVAPDGDVYVNGDAPDNRVVVKGAVDNLIGDNTVDGTAGNTVTDRIATAVTNHSDLTTGVHGVTGDVVGTENNQTLTNKTLGSGTNLSVALDMNGNKIEDLGTPTAGTDAATKNYVDDRDTATLGSANAYTDGEISDLDASLKTYADQAETDAKAYTDTRETAITTAYRAYADQAEADAVSTAAAYTDQAELDAIDAAADAAALLYAPLAGATFTGEVILHSDPEQALGAATKQYVDSVAEGLHIHASAVSATTGNVNIANELEPGDLVDGVTLAEGDRVLVKAQTNAAQNGIYVVQTSGAALRASDFNEPMEVDGGDFIFVTGGNTYDSTGWVQTSTSVVTIGTDPILFTQFSGAGTYLAGTGLELNGNVFEIDATYTATKSYVDGEISDLDTAAQGYADDAETAAKEYTDDREIAITNAYEVYADQAEADAKSHADGVALSAENNAKAYTDVREGAITTAYQNYADLAEADAKLYTDSEIDALDSDDIEEGTTNKYFTNQRAIDAVTGTITNAINALDTDDIEEGTTNLYHTSARAKSAAAELLTGATLENITITGSGSGLTITAENGVADSDTDDLEEGTSNLYFTNARAVTALEAVVPNFTAVELNSVAKQVAATLEAATAGVQVGYSWLKDDYRSAEFLVKVAHSTHTEISKVLLTLDSSDNISITEYGIVGTNGPLSVISATISGDDVQLLVDTENNDSTVTVVGTLLA
jgi:hypothetical protein